MSSQEGLVSCDTFVIVGREGVVFGKNSDRPEGEVQEVVEVKALDHPPGTRLKCTYIEVDQVARTLGVMLSKPAWMWGAEMGANEAGVVIGNEAVWNRLSGPQDLHPRLLGMDLLRLGLERSHSAEEAVTVITSLLESHGQGGQCSNIVPDFSYHNSFLIADCNEAWVLETAEKLWVAEKVEGGPRNISNCMSITTKIDRESAELRERARREGWWGGDQPLDWTKVIGASTGDLESPASRYQCGSRLLSDASKQEELPNQLRAMLSLLRDEESGICRRPGTSAFPTAASQASVLCSSSARHWFTGTPDPTRAVFKPFVFGSDQLATESTKSASRDGAQPHRLMCAQQESKASVEKLRKLEEELLEVERASDGTNMFNRAVDEEIKLHETK